MEIIVPCYCRSLSLPARARRLQIYRSPRRLARGLSVQRMEFGHNTIYNLDRMDPWCKKMEDPRRPPAPAPANDPVAALAAASYQMDSADDERDKGERKYGGKGKESN